MGRSKQPKNQTGTPEEGDILQNGDVLVRRFLIMTAKHVIKKAFEDAASDFPQKDSTDSNPTSLNLTEYQLETLELSVHRLICLNSLEKSTARMFGVRTRW